MYAVELSADEARANGASTVRFSEPVPFYVENFLGFPVGFPVPVGVLDEQRGVWVSHENGRVIGIVGVVGGLADVDTDGDGCGPRVFVDSMVAARGVFSICVRQAQSALRMTSDVLAHPIGKLTLS